MEFDEVGLLSSYLRSLDPPITALIRECSNDYALRAYALWCAGEALKFANVRDERLNALLSTADRYNRGLASVDELDDASRSAKRIALEYDARSGEERDRNAHVQSEIFDEAFNAARAAYTVYACTAHLSRCAAAFACYEAETCVNATTDPAMRKKFDDTATTMLGEAVLREFP